MKRLGRSLIILTVLTVAMISLIAPQPTRADWGECDADFMDRTSYCTQQHADCVNSGGTNCQSTYNACLDQSGSLRTTCINETDPTPQPLPVIDHSRSICFEGCQQGCGEIVNGPERFACLAACYSYCNENYPKP